MIKLSGRRTCTVLATEVMNGCQVVFKPLCQTRSKLIHIMPFFFEGYYVLKKPIIF